MTEEFNKNKSILRLVTKNGYSVNSHDKNKSIDYMQPEMFGCPNSILFTEVNVFDFIDIMKIIELNDVHYIIDLRDVPYLNFGFSNRNKFFQYIQVQSVEYLSFTSISPLINQMSIKDYLEKKSNYDTIKDKIGNWISQGPTLVVINQNREIDPLVNSFIKMLKIAKISFSEATNNYLPHQHKLSVKK